MTVFAKTRFLIRFSNNLARKISSSDNEMNLRYLRRLTGFPQSLCKEFMEKHDFSFQRAMKLMKFRYIQDTADGKIPEYLQHKGLLGLCYGDGILCSLRVFLILRGRLQFLRRFGIRYSLQNARRVSTHNP